MNQREGIGHLGGSALPLPPPPQSGRGIEPPRSPTLPPESRLSAAFPWAGRTLLDQPAQPPNDVPSLTPTLPPTTRTRADPHTQQQACPTHLPTHQSHTHSRTPSAPSSSPWTARPAAGRRPLDPLHRSVLQQSTKFWPSILTQHPSDSRRKPQDDSPENITCCRERSLNHQDQATKWGDDPVSQDQSATVIFSDVVHTMSKYCSVVVLWCYNFRTTA